MKRAEKTARRWAKCQIVREKKARVEEGRVTGGKRARWKEKRKQNEKKGKRE